MSVSAGGSLWQTGGRVKSWSRYLVRWFGRRQYSFSSSAASHLPPSPLVSSWPISSSASTEEHPQLIVPCLPHFGEGSMELMAVPKKKVSPYKRGLRNGPKALKPAPVIVRCKSCGRVKLPHFYCCSGDKGFTNGSTRSVD